MTPPEPLSLSEKRVIYGQLVELGIVRVQLIEIRSSQAKELEQYEAEKKLWEARIEQEKQAYELAIQRVAVTERERDLAKEKAAFYKNSLDVCNSNKKTSFGCKLKRFFTIGIARCK